MKPILTLKRGETITTSTYLLEADIWTHAYTLRMVSSKIGLRQSCPPVHLLLNLEVSAIGCGAPYAP